MRLDLEARLLAVAEMIILGQPVADIGSDHLQLPLYLVGKGLCPRVIATDKSAASYARAQSLLAGISTAAEVELRLGNGLAVLQPGEAATIVLAGMGSALICDILQQAPEVLAASQRLVLQPQSQADQLRRWLMDNGWRIVEERLVWDRGFYYVIIAAEQGKMSLSRDELCFGPCLLRLRPPLLARYLQHNLARLRLLIAALQEQPGQAARNRLMELKEELDCTQAIAECLDKE